MLSRKAISLNGLSAVLATGTVARVGELACIDVATGLIRPALAGVSTLRALGTFTENLTGDGSTETFVAFTEELSAITWLNDTVAPVVMPGHRGSTVYMKDGATVTSSDGGGANAPAGVALDIDAGGRVIVLPPRGPESPGGGGGSVVAVTATAPIAETIDGAASVSIIVAFGAVELQSRAGVGWYVTGGYLI